MQEKETKSTELLLRVIVALLLRGSEPEIKTLRHQIQVLSSLGLQPLEIAKILGRSNIYVNKELTEIRKLKKKKKYEKK